MQIHPELEQTAKRTPAMQLTRNNIWLYQLLIHLSPAPPPKDIHIENIRIPRPGSDTKIQLRLYKPKSQTQNMPVLIWHHGGGLVMGRPEIDDARCARFVRELGITVISVKYRYAPRHPFPRGLEDSYAALKWVYANAAQLSIDQNRIGVGGASAGGCMAAALTQLAYDHKEVPIKTQLLVYPMLDDRSAIDESLPNHSPVWTKQSNRFGWESYLGLSCGSPNTPAYAIPARRTDLTGLPPAWIGVGTIDFFHNEDVAYAQRLQAANVTCDLCVIEGAFHGFDVLAPQTQVVEEFTQAQIAALKKNLIDVAQIP